MLPDKIAVGLTIVSFQGSSCTSLVPSPHPKSRIFGGGAWGMRLFMKIFKKPGARESLTNKSSSILTYGGFPCKPLCTYTSGMHLSVVCPIYLQYTEA